MEAAFLLMVSLLEHLEEEGLVSVQQSRGEDLLPNVCLWVLSAVRNYIVLSRVFPFLERETALQCEHKAKARAIIY